LSIPIEATSEEQARRLDALLTADLEPLETEIREQEWIAESTGSEQAFARVEELGVRIMRRLASAEEFSQAEALLAGADRLSPLTVAAMRKWRNQLAANQLDEQTIERLCAEESALVQLYNSHRARLGARLVSDNELDRILLESTDSDEVEAAWRASKTISGARSEDDERCVADRLVDLVRLRNEAARQIGYDNAYRSGLELGEMSQDWLYEMLDLLEERTTPLFEGWKRDLDESLARRFGIGVEDLRPWHYRERFFSGPPPAEQGDPVDERLRSMSAEQIVEMTVCSFDELGFDIRPIVARSDLFPGDPETSRKCQHAFCTTIVAPSDVRVLCNVVPGERWMSTCLHEYGHAVYGANLDGALPFVLRDDAHLLTNEAIAMLMERLMLDAGWLHRVLGLSQDVADEVASRGRRTLAERHLVFTRWVLVMCHFERALYENPDHADLGGLWWDLVERFQGVERPEPGHRGHDWASKIHFVGHPAYYQNYLMGEVFGAQLQHAVEAECGGFAGNAEAGRFLRDRMFRKSASLSWQDLMLDLSGEPLTPDYFLAALEPLR
jgi:peptidyl-dipeptidase A